MRPVSEEEIKKNGCKWCSDAHQAEAWVPYCKWTSCPYAANDFKYFNDKSLETINDNDEK